MRQLVAAARMAEVLRIVSDKGKSDALLGLLLSGFLVDLNQDRVVDSISLTMKRRTLVNSALCGSKLNYI
jgi:hypothetical protein